MDFSSDDILYIKFRNDNLYGSDNILVSLLYNYR